MLADDTVMVAGEDKQSSFYLVFLYWLLRASKGSVSEVKLSMMCVCVKSSLNTQWVLCVWPGGNRLVCFLSFFLWLLIILGPIRTSRIWESKCVCEICVYKGEKRFQFLCTNTSNKSFLPLHIVNDWSLCDLYFLSLAFLFLKPSSQ